MPSPAPRPPTGGFAMKKKSNPFKRIGLGLAVIVGGVLVLCLLMDDKPRREPETAPPPPASMTPDKTAGDYFAAGMKLKDSAPLRALEQFRQVEKLDPDYPGLKIVMADLTPLEEMYAERRADGERERQEIERKAAEEHAAAQEERAQGIRHLVSKDGSDVGVARTRAAHDRLVTLAVAYDTEGMSQLALAGLAGFVPSGTKCRLIDRGNPSEVRILDDGPFAGEAVWVLSSYVK